MCVCFASTSFSRHLTDLDLFLFHVVYTSFAEFQSLSMLDRMLLLFSVYTCAISFSNIGLSASCDRYRSHRPYLTSEENNKIYLPILEGIKMRAFCGNLSCYCVKES